MNEEHLENTFHWLVQSAALRQQVDCLTPPQDRETNARYWQSHWSQVDREDYAIMIHEPSSSARHLGNCGLCNLDMERRKGQLWIYLGHNHQGQGVGTIATRYLIARGFEALRLNRIYLRVVDHNTQAIRFYRKLGFIEEGILRHDTHIHTRPVDIILFAMLAENYASMTWEDHS